MNIYREREIDFFSCEIDRLMGGGHQRGPLLIDYQLYMKKLRNVDKNTQKICKYT